MRRFALIVVTVVAVLSGVARGEEILPNPIEPLLVHAQLLQMQSDAKLVAAVNSGESVGGFPNWGERVIHELINRSRVDPATDLANCPAGNCGEAACYGPVEPLTWSLQLSRSARFHSDEMGRQGYFAHDSRCRIVTNIDSLYPSSCDGSAACACTPGGTPVTNTWGRIGLFGGSGSGEIITSATNPTSAFYSWLHENSPSPACAYSTSNGHRWIILTSGGSVGLGIGAGGAVGDFGGPGSAASKIPSGAHFPRSGSVELWANWYDGAAPGSAQVVIDGSPIAMTLQRGTSTNGAWRATYNNTVACQRYFFRFVDSTGATVRYPSSGTLGLGDVPCADWAPAAAGDFNADVRDDIVLRDAGGGIGMWLMNGAAIAAGSYVGSTGGYSVAGIADFDGNGNADILLRDSLGNLGMWLMNGSTIVSGRSVGSPGAYTVAGVGDFNGDGRADILLRDGSGSVGVWFMNGGTITAGALVGTTGTSVVAGVGDFNGDGKADILLQDPAGGIGLWMMNGAAVTTGASAGSAAGYTVAGVGDFNGDGKADVLLRSSTGNIGLWVMNGSTIVSGALVGSPAAYQVNSVRDYNGDGRADILLRNSTTGDIGIWFMNGPVITAGAAVGSPGAAFTVY
jgi:hypothetical protein